MKNPLFRRDHHYIAFIWFLELNALDIFTTWLYFYVNPYAVELSPIDDFIGMPAFLTVKAILSPILFALVLRSEVTAFRRVAGYSILFLYIFAVLSNLANIVLFIK